MTVTAETPEAPAIRIGDIRQWSGDLTEKTAARIRDLIEAVLFFPCTVVTITGHLDAVEVRTGCHAERGNCKDTTFVVLEPPSKGLGSWVRWSIGGYAWSIHVYEKDETRVSWYNGQLRIDLKAPAGHRLVWIFAPEVDQ